MLADCRDGDPVVLGLDLSLTSTGAVVLPADWTTGWGDVLSMPCAGYSLKRGQSESARIQRILRICGAVVEFAREHRVTHAFVEQHAFSQNYPSTRERAELTGVIKTMLEPFAGIPIAPVVATQARKYLLGKCPRSKRGVIDALKDRGAPFRTSDDGDAFVVANFGRHLLGQATFAEAT